MALLRLSFLLLLLGGCTREEAPAPLMMGANYYGKLSTQEPIENKQKISDAVLVGSLYIPEKPHQTVLDVLPKEKPVFKVAQQAAKETTKSKKLAISSQTNSELSQKVFRWPVKGKVILGYGPRQGGYRNDGINIAAPHGAPVVAAQEGEVIYTGSELDAFGNLVLIKHENNWLSAYAHLDKINVKKGQIVEHGRKLGSVGKSGGVRLSQLHFEIRNGSRTVNPTRFLKL
ncbi:MAG: peptidoglycan DD-metalloendopeptidase family protein [Alphaproteobacteria bacterium]|nr:peptidoglycan DD-metalloendopeptidase family protein [Alphaproteobacteria bacterium]MBT5540275.1 peptidoglycan DD-metalloendopeptidase family protein [Alphaproteobacteria bacterium]